MNRLEVTTPNGFVFVFIRLDADRIRVMREGEEIATFNWWCGWDQFLMTELLMGVVRAFYNGDKVWILHGQVRDWLTE